MVFLLSPAAAYITGDTLRVDGGSSLDRHVFPLAAGTPVEPFRGFHLAADLPGALLGDDG